MGEDTHARLVEAARNWRDEARGSYSAMTPREKALWRAVRKVEQEADDVARRLAQIEAGRCGDCGAAYCICDDH